MKKTAPDHNALYVVILIIIVLLTYSSSIFGAFLLDDYKQILANPYTKSLKHLPAIFSSGFGRLDKTVFNYYRPLVEISYIPDYMLWGFNPQGYHFTNILIHIISIIILFFLLNALFGRPKISFFTSLFVGVHPIYTSAVTYLSGRADLLMIFFTLLSLLFLIKYLEGQKKTTGQFLIASCASYFLALLAKEASLIMLAIILLIRYIIPSEQKKWKAAYVLYAASSIAYLLIRVIAIKGFFVSRYEAASVMPLSERLFTAMGAFLDHLIILILPFGLHFDRSSVIARSFADPKIIGGMAAFFLILYTIFRLHKTKSPIFFGLAWFLLTYLPISNLLIPLNTFVAENWMQLPAIGILLALSGFVISYSENRTKIFSKILLVFYVSAILLYATSTMARNNEYSNPTIFYEQNLRHEPKNINFLYLLGLEYEKNGNSEKAIELYDKILTIAPANCDSINNLANIYAQRNEYAKAIDLYKRALRAEPDNIMVLNNLGITYARKGDRSEALSCWEKSLKLNSAQPVIRQYIDFYKNSR